MNAFACFHLVCASLIYCVQCSVQSFSPAPSCSGTFFATFNIQNYGASKASRPAVLQALATIVMRYDVVAIQELSQKPSGTGACGENTMSAICDLLVKVNDLSTKTFGLSVSPRIGDEQYAVIFDSEKITVASSSTYPDPAKIHTRPPHAFELNLGATSMVIAQTHTKPGDATAEIQNFPNVLSWMETTYGDGLKMLVGDYNADGSYFDEDSSWAEVLSDPHMSGYSLRTGNEMDTTLAASSNTYDRIIASTSLEAEKPTVYRIENHLDLAGVFSEGCQHDYIPADVCSAAETDWVEIAKELSDHYPVEMCMHVFGDVAGAPRLGQMTFTIGFGLAAFHSP